MNREEREALMNKLQADTAREIEDMAERKVAREAREARMLARFAGSMSLG